MPKFSALTELTTPASADELAIVDKSDTSEAASGTTKRIQFSSLTPDGSITTAKLAADAVDGSKIADLAVDTEHLVNDAVTASKIADDAVQFNHIFDSAVRTNHIAPDNVTTATIADGAVTAAKLADSANGVRVEGTDLTNAAQTLSVGEGGIRTLRAGTLSGATTRAKTLGTSMATAGRIITVNLLDDNVAETVTIVNGGTGGGTLVTHNGFKARYEFRFDGTDWILSGWDVVQ